MFRSVDHIFNLVLPHLLQILSPDSGPVTKISSLLHIGHVTVDEDDIDYGCIIEPEQVFFNT
jgi:hypothetical protein